MKLCEHTVSGSLPSTTKKTLQKIIVHSLLAPI